MDFSALTDNTFLYTILVSTGVVGVISKYVAMFVAKVPLLKIKKWLRVAGEVTDLIHSAQKATDQEGDGGGDITREEWNELYKDGRELGQAIKALK